MSASVELLIVEDDDAQYETYSDTAEELNEIGGDINFILTRKKNSKEAAEALLSNDFNAAIVDLNLDDKNMDEASGNDVLKKIVGLHRFPIFVVSGNLSNLDDEIKEKESLFLRFIDRDSSTTNLEIFNDINKICNTGITQILGGTGVIETKLTEIFWNHLADDFDVWLENDGPSEETLLRYTLSHLSEYLDLPSSDNHYYNDAEFYIKPPIRPYIATGDIVKKDEERFVILSPACDISVRKIDENNTPTINANRLTLAKLITVDRDNFIENNIIKENDNADARKNSLKAIINLQQDKYIFLPEYKELDAAIVDLQNLYAIDFDDYLKNYERIATISSSFLKDIQSRFSSYYGRQGQPDLDKKELLKKHKGKL